VLSNILYFNSDFIVANIVIVSSNVIANSRALRDILYFNSEFILANIVIVSNSV